MSEYGWVSIVSLLGCLVLAVSSLQGRRLGLSKTMIMASAWVAIFLLVVGFFAAIGGVPA